MSKLFLIWQMIVSDSKLGNCDDCSAYARVYIHWLLNFVKFKKKTFKSKSEWKILYWANVCVRRKVDLHVGYNLFVNFNIEFLKYSFWFQTRSISHQVLPLSSKLLVSIWCQLVINELIIIYNRPHHLTDRCKFLIFVRVQLDTQS